MNHFPFWEPSATPQWFAHCGSLVAMRVCHQELFFADQSPRVENQTHAR